MYGLRSSPAGNHISGYTVRPGFENLGSAIHLLHPWAVDLSSSVETDGHKDPDKIVKAVQTVRNIKEDF